MSDLISSAKRKHGMSDLISSYLKPVQNCASYWNVKHKKCCNLKMRIYIPKNILWVFLIIIPTSWRKYLNFCKNLHSALFAWCSSYNKYLNFRSEEFLKFWWIHWNSLLARNCYIPSHVTLALSSWKLLAALFVHAQQYLSNRKHLSTAYPCLAGRCYNDDSA